MKKSLLLLVSTVVFGCSLLEAGMEKNNIYFVILAGGNGERLWPLSRQSKPKQLLSVVGEDTLLDQAINRVLLLTDKEHIWISTTKQHEEKIRDMVGHKIGRIVVEPSSCNTGPAILLSCCEVQKENPDGVVVFLPADPFIPEKDDAKFIGFLEHAIHFVDQQNRISLLGVKPTYPATGYGYIEFDQTSAQLAPFNVSTFHEKPMHDVAVHYCKSGNMLWNIGMFCGKASVFLEEFKIHAREMFDGVVGYLAGIGRYEDVVADSVDYAIMEKSNRVSVLPVDFAWCDVGNIEVFLSLKEKHKALQENVISVDAHNNLIDVPDQLVALVGVSDLCVVKTGDVLLITKRAEAEHVKKVVKELKRSKDTDYL